MKNRKWSVILVHSLFGSFEPGTVRVVKNTGPRLHVFFVVFFHRHAHHGRKKFYFMPRRCLYVPLLYQICVAIDVQQYTSPW